MSVEVKAKKANKQGGLTETIRIVIHALILAMIVRVLFFQPFNIPSGSMKPTLLVGDYLFVSKYSYGYSKYSFFNLNLFNGRVWASRPKRGDVAVFKLPRDNKTDYIKRVIGLPGDEIQMRNGVLYINGVAVPKQRVEDFVTTNYTGHRVRIPRYEETLPNGVKYFVLDSDQNGSFDNTNVYKVPANHFFMMGDNRDNSTDSRVQYAVGYVPFENFIGRAEIIFFSADQYWSLFAPWRWISATRWSRIFHLVR